MSIWAVVPAAGAGVRMGAATPKQFLAVAGRPVLAWALRALDSWAPLEGMIVVVPPGDEDRVRGLIEGAGVDRVLRVVSGGVERQESVRLGLEALREAGPEDLVLIHDGARPFPPVEHLDSLCEAARPHGALLAVPCRDTLKRDEGGESAETVDRSRLWQAQTPQCFPVGLLREAMDAAKARGERRTDESALVEALGLRPRLILGTPRNIKVTIPEDLSMAEAIAGRSSFLFGREGTESDEGMAMATLEIGHGYDVHRLAGGRALVLGGVEVPFEMGLLGHSDADVLAHAVADACLGAAGLGDLGRHFPDSDPAWKGISSVSLLEKIAELLRDRRYRVLRVDATLVAQRPKVAPYASLMEQNLSRSLSAAAGQGKRPRVTVKATTTEGLGFEGRGEGMSAHAVALVARGG